jgi:hypothetical protein
MALKKSGRIGVSGDPDGFLKSSLHAIVFFVKHKFVCFDDGCFKGPAYEKNIHMPP